MDLQHSRFGKDTAPYGGDQLRVLHCTMLLVLLAGHAVAQETTAEANLKTDVVSKTEIDAPSAYVIKPIAPEAPKPRPVFDKKFMAVMGILGTAEALRSTTTALTFEHAAAEGAPFAMGRPSNASRSAKASLIFGSEMLVAYELKKPHDWLPGDKIIRKLWWVYPLAMAAVHFKSAVGNMQQQPPAGCTVDGCP